MIFTIELPSKGKVRHIPRVLKVSEWTLQDIKEMSKASNEALDDVFNDVLNRGIQKEGLPKEFHAGVLPDQDRLHILLTVRGNTVGFEYQLIYIHRVEDDDGNDTCGEENPKNIDLRTDVTYRDIPSNYADHLGVKLPSIGSIVRVKVPSFDYTKESKVAYEEAFNRSIDDMMEKDPEDAEAAVFYVALYFSGVDNRHFKDILEAIDFCDNTGYKDSNALIRTSRFFRNWGPNLMMSGKCKKCNRRFQFRLPFLDSFFYEADRLEFDIESAIEVEQVPQSKSSGQQSDDSG